MSAISYYVINLERSKDRLHNVQEQSKKAGIPLQRIEAVDGCQINVKNHPNYDDQKCLGYFGRSLKAGEIACYESHLRALKTFLESDTEYGVVFEDDFVFGENFQQKLEASLEWLEAHHEKQWQIINFCAHKVQLASALKTFEDVTVYAAHYFPMSGFGILWTREGAERFIKESEVIFLSFDAYCRYLFTRDQKGLCLFPPLVHHGPTGADSDIMNVDSKESKHPFYWFIRRRRLIYEKLIALKNLICFRALR